MQLHHHAVLDRHARHLHQHMAAEQLRLPRTNRAARHLGIERLGLFRRQIGGEGAWVAMIGRCRARGAEIGAALLMRAQIAGIARILACHGAETLHIVDELGIIGVQHRVGAIGGHDLAAPAGLADRPMMVQRIERPLGRRDHLDIVTFEQRARAEGVGLQRGVDHVIIMVGGRRLQPHVDAERLGKDPVQPHARRRAAEQVIALGKAPPDRARIAVGSAAVDRRDAQLVQPDALAVQHAEHIMVGHDQQLRRVGEGLIIGEPARIGVAVRADDRQVLDRGVEPTGDVARRGVRRKEAIGMETQGFGQDHAPWSTVPALATT